MGYLSNSAQEHITSALNLIQKEKLTPNLLEHPGLQFQIFCLLSGVRECFLFESSNHPTNAEILTHEIMTVLDAVAGAGTFVKMFETGTDMNPRYFIYAAVNAYIIPHLGDLHNRLIQQTTVPDELIGHVLGFCSPGQMKGSHIAQIHIMPHMTVEQILPQTDFTVVVELLNMSKPHVKQCLKTKFEKMKAVAEYVGWECLLEVNRNITPEMLLDWCTNLYSEDGSDAKELASNLEDLANEFANHGFYKMAEFVERIDAHRSILKKIDEMQNSHALLLVVLTYCVHNPIAMFMPMSNEQVERSDDLIAKLELAWMDVL